VNKSSAY